MLKILESTRGLPGAQPDPLRDQQARAGQKSGCAPQSCALTRVCKQVCPSVCTTKDQLKALPTEQAGSMSPRKQPGRPIVEKGCLSRDKR